MVLSNYMLHMMESRVKQLARVEQLTSTCDMELFVSVSQGRREGNNREVDRSQNDTSAKVGSIFPSSKSAMEGTWLVRAGTVKCHCSLS